MPKRVEHPWPKLLHRGPGVLVTLLHLGICQQKGTRMLLFQAGMVNVSAFGRRGPEPALGWLLHQLPAICEDESYSGTHRNQTACGWRLSLSNVQTAVLSVFPTDIFPFQAVALFGTKARLDQDSGN